MEQTSRIKTIKRTFGGFQAKKGTKIYLKLTEMGLGFLQEYILTVHYMQTIKKNLKNTILFRDVRRMMSFSDKEGVCK